MHNITFHNERRIKQAFNVYKKEIDQINKKMDFIKKHRNIIEQRNEKLVDLLKP